MKLVAALMILSTLATTVYAQLSGTSDKSAKEIAWLAGTIQPAMLQGGNFEVDFYTTKMVFNYSHGFSLDLDGKHKTTVGEIKSQGLALHLPYSTGFGVGYRITRYLDIRLEPKLHRFQVYYDGSDR